MKGRYGGGLVKRVGTAGSQVLCKFYQLELLKVKVEEGEIKKMFVHR